LKDFNRWQLQDVKAGQIRAGGRPAAQLEMTLAAIRFWRICGSSPIRHLRVAPMVTLENKGNAAISLKITVSVASQHG